MAVRENFSCKREAIYDAVASTRSHPSVEWVYATIRAERPDVSLATVYRNLRRLCDQGRVRSIGVVNGQERFDADVSDHGHFICTRCGRILDISEPFVQPGTLAALQERYGLEITGCDTRFHGICSACRAKEALEPPKQKSE